MSRVGNKAIPIPSEVDVAIGPEGVVVKGPKGSLTSKFSPWMKISHEDGTLKVERSSDEPERRALHGLTRSLLANMVIGVTEGYAKTLEFVGVGYRAQQSGKDVILNVMLSHQVKMEAVPGIELQVEGNNLIHIRGIDKQLVGQVAAEIRKIRRPNVYTGKGIRYAGEVVRLKPGKSARRT